MPLPRLTFPRPMYPDGSDGLRLQVRTLLVEHGVAPRVDGWRTGFDAALSRALAARGWVGMAWPSRYGGRRSPLDRHVVLEELLAAGAPLAGHWAGDAELGPLVLRRGTEPQRARLLPAIARGERVVCALPPGAHLAASEEDGAVRLRGTAAAMPWAARADWLMLPVEGRTAVVEAGSPGVVLTPSGGVELRDVLVPAAMVVAGEPAPARGPETVLGAFPLLRRMVAAAPPGDAAAARRVGRLSARLWALRRLWLSVAATAPGLEAALLADLGAGLRRELGAPGASGSDIAGVPARVETPAGRAAGEVLATPRPRDALWALLEARGLVAAGVSLPMAEAAEVVRVAAAAGAPVPLGEAVLLGWTRGAVPPSPERAAVPDDGDTRRLGALVRAVQLVGATERMLELAAELPAPPPLATLTGAVACARAAIEHALEFPGEMEVAAARVSCGEAAGAARELAGGAGDAALDAHARRVEGWRGDFGDGEEWALRLGRGVVEEPGLLWGHAPARGTD